MKDDKKTKQEKLAREMEIESYKNFLEAVIDQVEELRTLTGKSLREIETILLARIEISRLEWVGEHPDRKSVCENAAENMINGVQCVIGRLLEKEKKLKS